MSIGNKGGRPRNAQPVLPRRAAGEMTDRQDRFVREYLVDLNAPHAAIRAGYRPKYACELLRNPKIAAAIATAQSRVADRLEVTIDRVVKEYARIAFLDIRKAFDERGALLPIHDLDDDTAAAIAGLEVEALYEGRGEDREVIGHLHKIKLAGKVSALDSLAKHLGMFVEYSVVDVTVTKAYEGFDPDEV